MGKESKFDQKDPGTKVSSSWICPWIRQVGPSRWKHQVRGQCRDVKRVGRIVVLRRPLFANESQTISSMI